MQVVSIVCCFRVQLGACYAHIAEATPMLVLYFNVNNC